MQDLQKSLVLQNGHRVAVHELASSLRHIHHGPARSAPRERAAGRSS
jgi:hypothetical protein